MRILVWGLGYVGTVSAACLAQLGHQVIAIEPNLVKVQSINNGYTPIKEPGLGDLISRVVASGNVKATTDGSLLVANADISLICVGTPSAADGNLVLDYIKKVAADIGYGLREASSYHVVVLRSTVFPGVTRNVLCPLLEKYSGKVAGQDFGLVANPEFLREASAISDFYAPPYTVIGQWDTCSGDQVATLYQDINADIYRITLEEAEILKMVNNAFHGFKIGFANEIGRLCEALELDGHKVMQMVCADTKLNISKAYLKPGFAFGGSCLPKDLRSLIFNARRLGVAVPMLEAVLPSNSIQIETARIKVHKLSPRCVGVLGLSFKAETDDLRESPTIALIRSLWQDGIDVLVYDPSINLDTLLGSNREYLERQLPQIKQILKTDVNDIINQCQAVIVTQHSPSWLAMLETLKDVPVIDLVGLSQQP